MRKYCLIILCLLGSLFSIQGQEAKAILDHDEIKIGEQTTIDLEFRCPAAVNQIMMPALKDTITKFVEIIDVSNIDTTFDEEDISTKIFTQKITITSWDSGYHAIPPFKFVVGGDTIKTQALLLTVNTIPIQAEQDIKDIKEIIEVPFSLWDWILSNRILLLSILGAIILIIVGIVLFKKYMNRSKEEEVVIVPKEAADIVANKKLKELEDKKLWQGGKVKPYYSELSFIIREYIENRFELRALELTTDEITLLMKQQSEVTAPLKEKLYQILLLADMAKFAKQQPIASENEEALKFSFQFVEQTALKEEVLSAEETNSTTKKEDNA